MDLDIMSALKLASEIGYEGVEISNFHSIGKEKGDEIFDLASSLNLEVFCVQGGNPYTDPSFTKVRIEMASRIGARFVNLGPGLAVRSKDERKSK
jgi:sugar phosphate isomerase/epimerase